MADNEESPPPSYDEAIYSGAPDLSAILNRSDRTDPSPVPASAPPFQAILPERQGEPPSLNNISDSPHSSDDEETALLKAELRRLRERDENEQKKALLRLAIERRRQAPVITSEGIAAQYPMKHDPVELDNYPSGTIVHPVASNIPGQAPPQPTFPLPYATANQGPSAPVETPGPSSAGAIPPGSSDASSRKSGALGCYQCTAATFCVIVVAAIVLLYLLL